VAYAQVRHAAGRPTYAVYELFEGRPALDPRLHSECDGFEEAVDCALRFLDRTDPERTGRVEALEIVRREGTTRETVWTYRYEPGYLRANPVDRWGSTSRAWHPTPRSTKPPSSMPSTLVWARSGPTAEASSDENPS
jgi:hypothetical protein